MSDETAKALEDATAEEARRRVQADRAKRECLTSVARGIPVRVEAIAKGVAQNQAEVTKNLGSDGIKKLRSDLAGRAAEIASDVEAASEKIEWPSSTNVRPRDVQTALFHFLYGHRVDSLARVFQSHGYSTDLVAGSQHLVHPHSLYDEGDFLAVAEALRPLAKARKVVAEAKAANDRDIVDSLWAEA